MSSRKASVFTTLAVLLAVSAFAVLNGATGLKSPVLLSASAEGEYRTLKVGDSGPDVLKLKERMYYLGYFNSLKVSDEYNATTVERVKMLQKANGLEQTGIATAELQELIFSDACVWTGKTPKPTAVPTPMPTPAPTPVLPIPTTDTGFLNRDAFGSDEYVLKDPEEGRWIYLSDSLRIEITRRTDEKERIRWFETEVYCSGETPLMTWLSSGKKGPGYALEDPVRTAVKNRYVLAISDDYYCYRRQVNLPLGVLIRNGQVMADKTYSAHKGRFPNLETLAVYEDGSMRTALSDEYSAQEYLDMGATNVFAFGPVLVHDGELGPDIVKPDYYHYREPRNAIGMIEPYHYLIVTVDGRLDKENIRGVYLDWLARLMQERGCTEALNMDGGGTAILVFMGERLNKTGSSIRSMNSMIWFGTSDQVR